MTNLVISYSYNNIIWTGGFIPALILFIILASICVVLCVLYFTTTILPDVVGAVSTVGMMATIFGIIWCSTELFNDQNYHIVSIESVTNSTMINNSEVQFSEYVVYIRENEDKIYKFAINNENIEWFKEKDSEEFTIDRFDLDKRIICQLDASYINRNN